MLVGGFVIEAFTPSELEPTTRGGCIYILQYCECQGVELPWGDSNACCMFHDNYKSTTTKCGMVLRSVMGVRCIIVLCVVFVTSCS